MKFRILTVVLFVLYLDASQAQVGKLVCFYNAENFVKDGNAQAALRLLEPALNFCNYLIYGYAGIDADTLTLKTLNAELSVNQGHFRAITELKRKYQQLRVLLSVGGDHDLEPEGEGASKYLRLLEDTEKRQQFKYSLNAVLQSYDFDGIDLAWQFPKSRPYVVRSKLKKAWQAVKNWFGGGNTIDKQAAEHKEQFTALARELKSDFVRKGHLLTLTVLPHVDAALFIDIPNILPHLDFVNLGTYDFVTPERDPKVADIPTSLYPMADRPLTHNVDHQVGYWLNQTTFTQKLNLGIVSYGRTWVMSRDSGITGYPPIPEAAGVAPAGNRTRTPGILSWPEICLMLHGNKELTGAEATLRKVGDPTKRYGIYAYRTADDNGEHGVWVGYEDPATVAIKADYTRAKGLGGVAFFDLSMDDVDGLCAGEKYPILRSIKYKL